MQENTDQNNAEYGHFSRSGLLFFFEDLNNFSI